MRRAAALRTLLGRVVRADARNVSTRAARDAPASSLPSAPLLLLASARAPLSAAAAARSPPLRTLLPPLAAAAAAVRHNHCSCPTLRDDSDGPPRVRIAYDPADVEAFIAVADAIEDAFPAAVVEGDDGDEAAAEAAAAGGGGGGGGAESCAVPVAAPVGGPGCEFTVTLPGGKVAFRAKAAPRDATVVLAAVRAAGGDGLLLAGEDE